MVLSVKHQTTLEKTHFSQSSLEISTYPPIFILILDMRKKTVDGNAMMCINFENAHKKNLYLRRIHFLFDKKKRAINYDGNTFTQQTSVCTLKKVR